MPARQNLVGKFMTKSIFNPSSQESYISHKIVAGLERISEAFKVLLWEKAKQLGLSPIQIQLLVFIHYHKTDLCNVSHLAKEFNVTKPTVSDAIRVLDDKGMIIKKYSASDSRRYDIQLSALGKKMVKETENFANPLRDQIRNFEKPELESLYQSLSKLIYQLNQHGILTVQRTCFGCKFYERTKAQDYCHWLEKELSSPDIRIDCPEYEERQ